jgi:hypothetical protein
MAKKSTRRLTLDDLSPESRRFWQQRGLLDKLPIGLLVALDRELEREAQAGASRS